MTVEALRAILKDCPDQGAEVRLVFLAHGPVRMIQNEGVPGFVSYRSPSGDDDESELVISNCECKDATEIWRHPDA